MTKQLLYGLLDEEGNVIRWTEHRPLWCEPRHEDYVVKEIKIERKKRVSAYEIAVRACGYAEF